VKTPRRILILYLSIGSGHLSAANAIKKCIKLAESDIKVFCEDLFTPALRDSVIPEFLSLNASLIFPKVYDVAWQSGSMMPGYELLQSTPLLRNRVLELLAHWEPDMVICTHTLPCSILAGLGSEKLNIPPLAAVSTDYMVHPYWPDHDVNGYVVGSVESADRLIARGVNEAKIHVFGIPIDPAAEQLSAQKLLKIETKTIREPLQILILAGGKRLAPYVSTWPKTLNLITNSAGMFSGRIHWNVVFGKPSAFSQILSDTVSSREDVTMFEYVTDFMDLLSRQDYVITKPGGLILAESMALGVPVILVNQGSGQEAANSEIILSNRGGILAESEKSILEYIQDVLDYPYIFQDARQAAFQMGKPAAARHTVEWLLKGME
jgi:processive 1,2-diacylglycerol beta-glucosyltransferase